MTSGLNGQALALCEFCVHRQELERLKQPHKDAKRTTIEMSTGEWVDYADPDPDSIKLRDIARGLSQMNRYNGLTPFPWSVADHALLVRRLVIDAGYPELALAALHHDDHEVWISDWPTPMKNYFEGLAPGAYRFLTQRFDIAICKALKLRFEDLTAEPVKEADELALRIEAFHLKPSRGMDGAWPWRTPPPVGRTLERRTPDETASAFVHAHVGDWSPVYA